MKLLKSFNEALSALKGRGELTFLLDDWDEGSLFSEKVHAEEIVKAVEAAHEKYGEWFSWRAFNESVEVSWMKESGTLYDEASIEQNKRKLLLETDYRRFGGAAMFWPRDFSEPHYTSVEVEEMRYGARVVHLRLLRLIGKEEAGDGNVLPGSV